jgi:hypothetical protein
MFKRRLIFNNKEVELARIIKNTHHKMNIKSKMIRQIKIFKKIL